MPAPSSEPEKYTIDEMMDRLKGRDSSDNSPELVTRSDGSQAMKVKKRRRRTNQAVNEETKRNQKIQVLQIAGFVVLLVVLGLAAGICVLYANSSSFRESLLGKLEDSSGAKVSLIQFRMNPATANAGKAVMEWPEGNALGSLDLTAITAKISPASFLGNAFSGEEIVAGKGELTLKSPGAADPKPGKSGEKGDMSVRFQRYSVPSLDIRFGAAGEQRRSLKGTEASFYPSMVSGQAEMRFQGGLLEFDAWPPLALDRSYIKVRDGSLDIQSMRFMMPKNPNERKISKGYIDFSGTLKPLAAGSTHTLEAQVQELSLPFLMGQDLGRFFLGAVDTKQIPDSNFLTFAPDSPDTSVLEITLTNSLNSRIDLGGFKFLSQLSVALDDRWYEYPNFDDEVSLLVQRRGAAVVVDKINLSSRGRMVVRGSVANAEGGGITGTLRIGIPETTVSAAPNKRLNLLFGEVREGYRWLDLEIAGTSAVPEDNFKELYLKAAETPAEEAPAPETSPDKFDNLIEGGE